MDKVEIEVFFQNMEMKPVRPAIDPSAVPDQIFFHAAIHTATPKKDDQITVMKWTNIPEPTVVDRVAAIDDPNNAQAQRVREWEDAQRGVIDWNSVKIDPPT